MEDVEKKKKDDGPSARKKLYDYVRDAIFLWKTPQGQPYADVQIDGKLKTWNFDSPFIDAFLREKYVRLMGGMDIPPANLIETVLKHLKSQALISESVFDPHLRVYRKDNIIYYDLQNTLGTIVTCTSEGWEVTPKNGIKFVSGDGMLPQVEPARDGSIELLRKYLSLNTEEDFRLIVSWLIGAIAGDDGYPILILNGGAGTAKSSTTSILRRLIDPHASERREPPKDDKDVAAIAKNAHVLAFDNLQRIPSWMSDTFCRVATGGTLSGRQYHTLHTDAGFEAIRPTILNGIPQFVEMNDLMERSILLSLPTIPPTKRRPWREIEAEFEKDRSAIVGGLLNAVCGGLKRVEEVHLTKLPRLAGWAKFMEAASPTLGWEGGFAPLWETQETLKSQELIGSNGLAQAIIHCLEEKEDERKDPVIRGCMRQIINQLVGHFSIEEKAPSSPRTFGAAMRRIQPDLEKMGIKVFTNGRSKNGQEYEIRLG